MECPKCKKDLSGAFKTVYKCGFLEGENQLQKTIKNIKATHRELLNELLRLDRVMPLSDNCIKLTRHDAKVIIKNYRRQNNTHMVIKLQKKLDEQEIISPELIKQILEKE